MSLQAALNGLYQRFQTIKHNVNGGPELPLLCFEKPPTLMQDNQFPSAIFYVGEGMLTGTQAGIGAATANDSKSHRTVATLIAEIHHARAISPQAIHACQVWPDKVIAALLYDSTLGGAVDAVLSDVKFEMTGIQYGPELHYGVRFEIKVKQVKVLAP